MSALSTFRNCRDFLLCDLFCAFALFLCAFLAVSAFRFLSSSNVRCFSASSMFSYKELHARPQLAAGPGCCSRRKRRIGDENAGRPRARPEASAKRVEVGSRRSSTVSSRGSNVKPCRVPPKPQMSSQTMRIFWLSFRIS